MPSTSSTSNCSPSKRDVVAELGRASELAEDEAADRVEVLVRQVGAEPLVELVDREHAVDAVGVLVDLLDLHLGDVELVLDLADDLLDQVLERDDAGHRAVLVDDDGEVLVRPAELLQQRREILRLGHDVRRPQQLLELARPRARARASRRRGRARAATPTTSSSVLAVDRIARVRRVEHGGERLLRRQLDRDGDDLGPRDHHVGDVLVAEDEDLVDHLLLLVLDLALLRRAREQHPQLGLGQRLALCARRLEAEHVQDARRSSWRSTQMSGAKTREERAHRRRETQSAVPSAWPSATPFGTSSPITTWTKVSRRYASSDREDVAIHGSNSCESACSPSAPMPSEVSVTPSCIAAMNCGGSLVMRSTARARLLPW